MIRGDNIVCGTTTTGTGTLTLAATPGPPGGIDFDVFARATGIGMANSAAVLVSYTIIEYTSSAFTTMKSHEKGIGTLTLGGSSGIANCTLARTTKQTTATSLDSQPATQNIAPATSISIGTAANTLVFIGTSAADVMAMNPYFDMSGLGCSDTYGIPPLTTSVAQGSSTLANNTFYYAPFIWGSPMLAKRASVYVSTAYSGGTPVSNAWARLYAYKTTGQPGKLLYDFGLFGSANTSLNSTGICQTGAAGNGFFMTPGDYFFCLAVAISGGVTAPIVNNNPGIVTHGRRGSAICAIGDLRPIGGFSASAAPSGTPNDPADLTSIGTTSYAPAFLLKDS